MKIVKPMMADFDNLLKHVVAPRPIAFASTVDATGRVNLSPFSYFNIVSQHPPICVFSPLRRMRDGSNKHTLQNIEEVREVVINVVSYDIVQQQSLASTEYEKGINEFVKAGFTAIPSLLVKPPRVQESPVHLECKVRDIISFGDHPGAGNMILAEVLLIHVMEGVLEDTGHVNQAKLDLVARLGADWYCRVTEENLFKVPKPLKKTGIGIDQLPQQIRYSKVLTGNHLGLLGNVEYLPDETAIDALRHQPEIQELLQAFIGDRTSLEIHLHKRAADLLDKGDIEQAWKTLLL